MKIKRLGLTVFFIALTLSIGLVSGHTPLSSANAQNSVLSQSGDSEDRKQETIQLQSSEHNGQVVSGDSSVLSGNNILCEDQDNPDIVSGLRIRNCDSEELIGSQIGIDMIMTIRPQDLRD